MTTRNKNRDSFTHSRTSGKNVAEESMITRQ
jgi:hypothetical protein